MKVAIISRCSPVEWIILQEVIRNFPEVTIIQPTSSPASNPLTNGVGNWFDGIGIKIINKLQKILLKKRLRLKIHENPQIKILQIPSIEMNKSQGQNLLTSISPDVLLTCIAPILKEEILAIPKKAAINIHFGISPEYRGNYTLFWPQFNRDFQHIGGTIHYISKGIDSGNILARVYPALLPTDWEVDVIEKTTFLLSRTIVGVLLEIDQQVKAPPGKVQNQKGRNYKKAERTFWLSLKFLASCGLGLYRSEARPQKVEFFI